MASSPAFVFVPGMASVGTVVYRPLISTLVAMGHDKDSMHPVNNMSVVEDLSKAPSFGSNALQSDIDQIRTLLKKLVENEQRDVLLVAHSYGGTPSLYAAAGLWKHQRAATGAAGGIIKIALIASSLSLPGRSVAVDRGEWLAANNQPPDGEGAQIEMVAGEAYIVPTGFENIWMNDITDEDYRSSLRPAALSSAMSQTPTDVGSPKDWRLSYLILTELDLAMMEGLQRHLIDGARAAGAEVEETTLKSGHFAQISHSQEVAEWLLKQI